VLADGLTVAAGSSRLLRGPSIYLGLLTLALVGPGVVSELWVLSWSGRVDLVSTAEVDAANEAIGRSAFLLAVAVAGLVAVSIEGWAIGAMLIAGRVTGRPVTLRIAIERSRRVFWRLVRVALMVGALEIIAGAAWRFATHAPPVLGDMPNVTLEPIPGAIVSLPFIYSTVAIVVADDGARAALRRSARLARQRLPLAAALTAFALLSGVVEGLALGSGLDLIVRVTEVLHLDVASGGASLFLAVVLALAIVTAAGSLVFTVSALVSAPQVVAWHRLGEPLAGMPAAVVAAAEAAEPEPTPAEPEPTPAEPEPTPAEPEPTPAEPEPTPAEPEPTPAPTPAPSAWQMAAERPVPFRWMTVPMRLTAIGMWLVALASLLGGSPV
jgi:cell division septation protein DedD